MLNLWLTILTAILEAAANMSPPLMRLDEAATREFNRASRKGVPADLLKALGSVLAAETIEREAGPDDNRCPLLCEFMLKRYRNH